MSNKTQEWMNGKKERKKEFYETVNRKCENYRKKIRLTIMQWKMTALKKERKKERKKKEEII